MRFLNLCLGAAGAKSEWDCAETGLLHDPKRSKKELPVGNEELNKKNLLVHSTDHSNIARTVSNFPSCRKELSRLISMPLTCTYLAAGFRGFRGHRH